MRLPHNGKSSSSVTGRIVDFGAGELTGCCRRLVTIASKSKRQALSQQNARLTSIRLSSCFGNGGSRRDVCAIVVEFAHRSIAVAFKSKRERKAANHGKSSRKPPAKARRRNGKR
jgi:hypothetical protein